MKIRMIGDKLLVKVKEKENKTQGGIILTSDDPTENLEGEVVEAGQGWNQPMTVKQGDTIIFPKAKYPKYEDYYIISEASVLMCFR